MADTTSTPYSARRGLLDVFRREFLQFHVAHDTFLPECVLATYVANRLPFSSVWLLIVGPPSSGKTAVLDTLGDLPDIHEVSTITVASLLSGSPKRERQPDSTGGILREIGDFGVLVVKDFTSILSMGRDNMFEVLAAMREVYDGSLVRRFGSDGGKKEVWKGKIGLIGAVTQTIDQKHSAMSLMGERFVLFRIPSDQEQSVQMAKRTLDNSSSQKGSIKALRPLASSIVELAMQLESPIPLSEGFNDVLISLSLLVASCRTGIERDGYNREIVHISDHEEPARLAKQLFALAQGLLAIGNTPEEALERVRKVGLDSVPDLRRKAIFELREADGYVLTRVIADGCHYPPSTMRRVLEELKYLDIIEGIENPEAWKLKNWVLEHLEAIDANLEELTDIPFEVVDLIDVRTTPEKGAPPFSISAANTEEINRVSSPPQNTLLREHVKRNQERMRNAAAN